jgi:hypothetical protein
MATSAHRSCFSFENPSRTRRSEHGETSSDQNRSFCCGKCNSRESCMRRSLRTSGSSSLRKHCGSIGNTKHSMHRDPAHIVTALRLEKKRSCERPLCLNPAGHRQLPGFFRLRCAEYSLRRSANGTVVLKAMIRGSHSRSTVGGSGDYSCRSEIRHLRRELVKRHQLSHSLQWVARWKHAALFRRT